MQLTSQHMRWYKASCRKYLKLLGINRYLVKFEWMETQDKAAACGLDVEAGVCYLYLDKEWLKEKITKSDIDRVAIHEVYECLLGPLALAAEERFISERELECRRHEIIQTLMNTFHPK